MIIGKFSVFRAVPKLSDYLVLIFTENFLWFLSHTACGCGQQTSFKTETRFCQARCLCLYQMRCCSSYMYSRWVSPSKTVAYRVLERCLILLVTIENFLSNNISSFGVKWLKLLSSSQVKFWSKCSICHLMNALVILQTSVKIGRTYTSYEAVFLWMWGIQHS